MALVDAGLFAEKTFVPVRSIDTPDPDIPILDSSDQPLKPMYTPAELDVLRQHERAMVDRESSRAPCR